MNLSIAYFRLGRFVFYGVPLLFLLAQFGGRAATAASAGEDIFTRIPVWRIEIELTPQNVERLRVQSRKYVRADVRASGELLPEVGIHLKGSTGSFRGIDDDKPSFT